MLSDTHCHLDFPEFDNDREEVIKRAKNSGIDYIINIGSSLEASKRSLELSKTYDFIYATVGCHPHDADKCDEKVQIALRELAREERVVAIGEVGLDYYAEVSASRSDTSSKNYIRDKNYSKVDGSTPSFDKLRTSPERPRGVPSEVEGRGRGTLAVDPEWNRRVENQKSLFVSLIKLAKDLGLPVVVHNRLAQEDTLKILKENMPQKVVVHCFSGNEDFLKECLDLGFFISFTCNITYKNANNLRNLVKITPLERLLLETDAPFLPPQEFRGKRNEPMYVKFLAEEIARIKGISIEEVAKNTTDNAKSFFKLR